MPELAGMVDSLATRKMPPTEPWARPAELRRAIGRLEERHLREMKQAEQALFAENPAELPEIMEQEILERNVRIKANQDSKRQNTRQYAQTNFRGR